MINLGLKYIKIQRAEPKNSFYMKIKIKIYLFGVIINLLLVVMTIIKIFTKFFHVTSDYAHHDQK